MANPDWNLNYLDSLIGQPPSQPPTQPDWGLADLDAMIGQSSPTPALQSPPIPQELPAPQTPPEIPPQFNPQDFIVPDEQRLPTVDFENYINLPREQQDLVVDAWKDASKRAMVEAYLGPKETGSTFTRGLKQGKAAATHTVMGGLHKLGALEKLGIDSYDHEQSTESYNREMEDLAEMDGAGPLPAWADRGIRSATSSFTQALPLGMATGATTVGRGVGMLPGMIRSLVPAAWFGSQQGMESYDEAKAKGLDEDSAFRYAAVQGAIEGGITTAFGALGGGAAEDAIAGVRSTLKDVVKNTLLEVGEEELIWGLSRIHGIESGVQESPDLGQGIQEFTDTAIATIIGMGMSTTPALASDFIGDPSRENANKLGIPEDFDPEALQRLAVKAKQAHEEYMQNKQQREDSAQRADEVAAREEHDKVVQQFQKDPKINDPEVQKAWSILKGKMDANEFARDMESEGVRENLEPYIQERLAAHRDQTQRLNTRHDFRDIQEPTPEAVEELPAEQTPPEDSEVTEAPESAPEETDFYTELGLNTEQLPVDQPVPQPTDLPPLTANQFKAQLDANATTPEEADAVYKLWEARASALGKDLDSYVGEKLLGVFDGDKLREAGSPAAAEYNDNRRGQVSFLDDGRALIQVFQSQKVSTILHETGHVFRRDLHPEELNIVTQWAGLDSNEQWNFPEKGDYKDPTERQQAIKKWRAAEEKFARGFERYLRTGNAPTPGLAEVFAKFKRWLSNVYKAIKGSSLEGSKLNKEMRTMLDGFFDPEAQAKLSTPQAATEPEQVSASSEVSATEESPWPGLLPPEDTSLNQEQETSQSDIDTLSQIDPALHSVLKRFRGLANHALDPVARQANFDVDKAMGRPERKAWADAEAEASRRMNAFATGEAARLINDIRTAKRLGGTIDLRDMTEVVLAAKLKEAAAIQGYLHNDPAARTLHREISEAFRESRTEQARSLGYKDPVTRMSPTARRLKAMTGAMTTPSKEHEVARKQATNEAEHKAVDVAIEERYQKVKKELEKIGIDIEDIDKIAKDPVASMTVIEAFRPRDTTKWDKMYEYWRNAILSGPKTHATNIAGNTAFAGWHLGVERPIEAAVNLFVKDPKGAQLGEFEYMLGAMFPAAKRGIKNAFTAWKTERSSLSDELGRESAFKVDGPRGAIPGKLGKLVRSVGFRPLLAADEFAKTITSAMEASAHAYRIAKYEESQGKLKKGGIQKRVGELTSDYNSLAWDIGIAKAEELAFQGQRGLVAQGLVKGVDHFRKLPGGKFVIPFRDTPAGIMEEGLKRTPLLGAVLDYVEMRRGGSNLADAGMTPMLARQILALAGVALLWDWTDPDDPYLTGASVLTDKGDRELAYRTAPPQSVRMGNTWYNYARLEPFATPIAWTVDAIHGIRNGKPVSSLSSSTIQQLKSKSYLDGLGDAVDAVQGAMEGDLSETARWAGKFSASWVPNIYRQTMRSTGGEMSEGRVWGKEADYYKRTAKRALQSAEIPGVPSTSRFDVWGDTIKYNDWLENPMTSFTWDLLSPFKAHNATKVMDADLLLMRYRNKFPDENDTYSEVPRFFKDGEETVYFTDEQYAVYASYAGKLAKQAVEKLELDPDNPTKRQVDAVKSRISKTRRLATARLKKYWLVGESGEEVLESLEKQLKEEEKIARENE